MEYGIQTLIMCLLNGSRFQGPLQGRTKRNNNNNNNAVLTPTWTALHISWL